VKKIKKAMALSLAVAMGLSLVACGSESTDDTTAASEDTEAAAEDTQAAEDTEAATSSDTNEVSDAASMEAPDSSSWDDSMKINVYLWDADGEGKVQEVLDHMGDLADYVNIVNLGFGGQSDEYINGVNNALDGTDEYADVILADEGIAKQWSESDATADLNSLGITSDMYANAYSYTVQYGSYDGAQKALSWQATPGCFVYRADIASEVLGTDDPDEVGALLSDWDGFFDVAEQLKEAGYKIVSGTNEIKYPVLNQRQNPWVDIADDGTETLQLDDTLSDYIEKAKTLYDNDYTNQSGQWDSGWAGSMAEGDVFGYFGCTWFIGSMESNCAEDAANFGQWRTTTGPESFYWGGTYVMAGANTANPELAAYFIYEMCCDEDVMYDIAADTGDFVNNKAANERLIADGIGARDILGGQNPVETFAAAATDINVQSTYIDGSILSYVDTASDAYNTGEYASVDEAIQYIKDSVQTDYDYIVVE
jgi:hypothetical protein